MILALRVGLVGAVGQTNMATKMVPVVHIHALVSYKCTKYQNEVKNVSFRYGTFFLGHPVFSNW